MVFHEIETNGIGYLDLMFDLSDVPEKDLPIVGLLQAVLGIIDTEHYEYGELFNEINRHTGGIGTSLELYPDVTKVKEKEFKATFEIKGIPQQHSGQCLISHRFQNSKIRRME